MSVAASHHAQACCEGCAEALEKLADPHPQLPRTFFGGVERR
jgi:hypothetical protein